MSNQLDNSKKLGKLIGIGVGPGDPELITLKAYRLIQSAQVICYLANVQGQSQAKHIARAAFKKLKTEPLEIPVLMPMSQDRTIANKVYDKAADEIARQLEAGSDVIFLCEGDPLFFGSFAYLLERLEPQFECQVVPGISSVHAASAALVEPLTQLKQSFAVVSGRHDDKHLVDTLNNHDTVVIMKAGLSRPRILKALIETDRTQDACYLEYIGRDNQSILKDVTQLNFEAGPYFSLFVVRKQALKHS